MLHIILGHKCLLCGNRDKNNPTDKVSGYGIYNSEYRYFHRSCLKDIVCDPEHYSHRQVDMAITIAEKLEQKERQAVTRREKYKNNCNKIKSYCTGGLN